MADKKGKKQAAADRKPTARAVARERKEAKPAQVAATSRMRLLFTVALAIVAVIAVFAVFLFALRGTAINVPFSTFKANFDAAPRVAVFVTYLNQTQYTLEFHCSSYLVQSIASSRNVSIDFYVMNGTSCTFSPTGVGHTINGTETKAASYCTALEGNEPSILLNYAPLNLTLIRAYELTVYGNAAYMASCPIAVDIH